MIALIGHAISRRWSTVLTYLLVFLILLWKEHAHTHDHTHTTDIHTQITLKSKMRVLLLLFECQMKVCVCIRVSVYTCFHMCACLCMCVRCPLLVCLFRVCLVCLSACLSVRTSSVALGPIGCFRLSACTLHLIMHSCVRVCRSERTIHKPRASKS